MGYFPETRAADVKGRSIKAAWLVKLGFVAEPLYLWNGNGDLPAGGFTWKGCRGLGSIQGLEQAVNGQAPQVTLTISATTQKVLSLATGDPANYVNQMATIFFQFLNGRLQPLDDPYAIWAGRMQTLPITRAWDDGAKAWRRTLSLTCESWAAGRGRPPFSFYSDRDQQGRYPGDKALERMAVLQNKTVRWPDF